MTLLNVALIGCGKRARMHLQGLVTLPDVQIVALADLNPDAAEKLKTEFALPAPVFTDFRTMLERIRPDLVVSCLWTPLHRPAFEACVQAKVRAVHSEKPMAPTWGDCLAMAELAQQSGVQLTFSHQRRYRSGNRRIRQLIADGILGKIQRMDLYAPSNLLDCGTHSFDQALSFNQETPARWVLGAIDTTKLLNWFNVQSEAMATGTVVFDNDIRAHFQFGDPDKDLPTGVRLLGESGLIEVTWDGELRRAVRFDDPSWKCVFEPDTEQTTMAAMMADVTRCLRDQQEPEVSFQKALRASEIIFALYESVRRHRRVHLPLDTHDNPFLAMLATGHFPQG